MSLAGNHEKRPLLEVARRAMSAAVEGRGHTGDLPEIPIQWNWGGAFVTLHRRGRLRGCVGQVLPGGTLVETIAHCARAAALEDPRFDPVRPDELCEIEIELSVLSPLEAIAPEQIQAGKHGLMVTRGAQRGVLLPQVATQFRWNGQRLLEETCVKAGFDRDAWKNPEIRVEAFTAEIFSESDARDDSAAEAEVEAGSKRGYSSST
jgi:hypothetical protein